MKEKKAFMKKVWEFIKKHKKMIIILVIVIVLVVGGIYIANLVKKTKGLLAGMGNSATTEEIERRDIVNSVTATGTVVAVDKRTVSSTITGVKVKQLNVKVGDQVKAGDIICLLDGEDLEQQLADAQKMLNADAGRSNLDVASSNRGLNEAITSRDIDATRAEEDKKTAYNHAQDAGNEANEAKTAYDNAVNNTKALKNQMIAAENYLNQMKNPQIVVDTAALQMTQEAYESEVNQLKTYMNSVANDSNEGTYVANDCSSFGNPETDIIPYVGEIYTGLNGDIRNTIDAYLQNMSNVQTQYKTLEAGTNVNAANIEGAVAAYEKAKAAYESALVQEESQKSLYESKVKSVESMWESYNNVVRNADDSKRNNDSQVASRVDSVKNSQLSASTATLSDKRNVETLQEQIDSCVVTSSIDGIVTAVDVLEGDNYMGGEIVTIENTSDYEVSAQIDEYDIAKIEVGQEVVVKTNGTGTTEMKGVVKSIAPHATQNMNSSGVKYEVMVSILDKNEDIRLDMTAKIEIICEKSEGALSVATEAIQEDEEGKLFVEVLDSGSTIDSSKLLSNPEEMSEEDVEKLQTGEKTYESHNVYITKGLVGDYYTEISGEGLEEGTKIVIPNEGAMSDIEEYMSESGAAGGF